MYTKRLWSPQSSLRFFGSCISWITLIFDWSILIPRWWTMKPKSFPDVTLNTHLSRFIFNWHFHNRSKIKWRSCMWSSLFLDLTTNHRRSIQLFYGGYLHCPLVSCSCILKSEGHQLIAKNAFRCAESCGLLIFWRHQNLIVSCGIIHEW